MDDRPLSKVPHHILAFAEAYARVLVREIPGGALDDRDGGHAKIMMHMGEAFVVISVLAVPADSSYWAGVRGNN